MISIEFIRKHPDLVLKGMERRGEDAPIEAILELDGRRRSTVSECDDLRSHANEVSREFSRSQERPTALVEEMREVRLRIRELDETIRQIEEKLNMLLATLSNIPSEESPTGPDESSNILVRQEGTPPEFDFEPLPHWELGERLGIIDFNRGVKLSGSRFFVLTDKGSKLQRSLISWMLDLHTLEHGYDEIYLPFLVLEETMAGSGQLPKFADTMYHDDEDNLWMIPTAEVPLTGLHRGEIIDPNTLPISYVAHTPCFRREKAAAGSDTRGIKRVHQFEKVEMYKFVEPEDSAETLERLVADAEEICQRIGVPYRVIELSTGELSVASSRTFDIEVWAPGCNEWLEISSCSNCTDFQTRRAGIRYRPRVGARPRYPHTLNGSGTALPRMVISILENFQQADGSVIIPEILRPYTGFDRIGPR